MAFTRYPGRMIDYLLELYGTARPIGAELGVYEGDGALRILQTLNMAELWLVDPYEYYPEYKDYSEERIKEALHIAKTRLAPYTSRTHWLFLKASDAALLFRMTGRLLDFGYLDHNHFAEYVYPDIWNYTAVVRPGGVVGGHDFGFDRSSEGIAKVREAVRCFARETGVELILDGSKPDLLEDWWFVVTPELHNKAIDTYGTHEWREE